jgi:hypothetical protein
VVDACAEEIVSGGAGEHQKTPRKWHSNGIKPEEFILKNSEFIQ